MKKIFSCFLFNCFLICSLNAQIIFVAPNGNDNNNGSKDNPFATLQKARDQIRKWKRNNELTKGGVTVMIRGGNYQTNSAFVLTKEDAGTEESPIIYRAYNQEVPHFIGGNMIAAKDWKPLNNNALERIHPKVKANQLVELDVASVGLVNTKPFAPKNQFTTDWFIVDLLANYKRQPVSQYPNIGQNIRGKNDAGWITCNGSKAPNAFFYGASGHPEDKDTVNELDIDGINRTDRWNKALESGHELWLKGLWRTPWEPITMKVESINKEDNSIKLYEAPPQGMGSKYSAAATGEKPQWRVGSGKEGYYALNLLEEIDQPGEWALDVKDQKIYYYPPAPIQQLSIMISDRKTPIFQFTEVHHVRLEGIQMEGGLGNGVSLTNCYATTVAGCVIRNIGGTGVFVNGGDSITVQSNDLSETGGWGTELKNIGNRYSLSSGHVLVDNNHIHHIGILAFKEAIILDNCVGVKVSHNLIHDTPKGSIRTNDINNCLFEYNEIHNIALKEGDTGVFYSYDGWSTYGNIFRYNFSHHTNRANGFYSDDGDSGDFYTKNIVHDCLSGVMFGGGHDDLADNNLFVLSKKQSIDDRGKNRNYRLGTKYETNLTKFKLDESPWKEYAAELMKDFSLSSNLWSDALNPDLHPEYPNGCRMKNNVAVASGKFSVAKLGQIINEGNVSINTIPEAQFFNYDEMDLRSNNPQILEKFPELNRVFPQIGLVKDQFRNTIPSRKETGGLVNRTSGEVDSEDKMVDGVAPIKKGN